MSGEARSTIAELFGVHARLFRADPPALDELRTAPPMARHPTFSVVTNGFPRDVWSRLPLRDKHDLDAGSAAANSQLAAALDHLAVYPARYEHTARFVRLIAWVRAANESVTQVLTSASFPALPHAVFMSELALCHIPPRTVVEPSIRFLAENLLHEATHQELTIAILRGRLLAREFRSATSPRIPIPWRTGDEPRNSSWQIDRVLHAMAVYVSVLDYRADELADPELTRRERAAYLHAGREASDALDYLMREIVAHRGELTDDGRDWLDDVRGRGRAALERIRPQLVA